MELGLVCCSWVDFVWIRGHTIGIGDSLGQSRDDHQPMTVLALRSSIVPEQLFDRRYQLAHVHEASYLSQELEQDLPVY